MRKLSFILATAIFFVLPTLSFAQSAGDLNPPTKVLSTGIHDEPNGVAEGAEDVASTILKKANIAHGGKALDNLKTVSMKGKFRFPRNPQELDMKLIADVNQEKIRYELTLNRRAITIFQLDSSGGWSWDGYAKKPLTDVQKRDLRIVLRSGVFGMRTGALDDVQILRVDSTKNPNRDTVWMSFEGKTYNMVFDENNRVLAEGSIENNNLALTTYEDFRVRSGILIPFVESIANIPKASPSTITQGNRVRLTSVVINPQIRSSEWAIPR